MHIITTDCEIASNMAEPKEDENVPVGEETPHQNASPSLVSLNNFCLLKILKLLPRDDLYAMGQTCTQLEGLSSDVFFRRHPNYLNKVIAINSISDKGKIEHDVNEKYAKSFPRYIPNVILGKGTSTTTLTRLCKMYDESGCPIKSLQFNNWEAKLERSHGVTIRAIVEGIESITFTDMVIDGDLYENILQFMPNMKHLTFCKTFQESDGVDMRWMEKTYPMLESFAWHVSTFPAAKLKLLFQVNPSIRHFSLLSTSIETIQQVKDEHIHVDELFIDFDCFTSMKHECPVALEYLQVIRERQSGLKIHMKCNDMLRYYFCQHFDKLSPLALNIEGLYFESIKAIDDIRFTGSGLREFIFKCTNLKVFQVNHDTRIDWSKIASKLEKVFFFYKFYNQAISSLIYTTEDLKKIYARKSQLMEMRNGLKLKIYISSLASNNIIDKLNERDGDLVEVIRTETEMVNNPLVYMKAPRIRHKGPREQIDKETRALLGRIFGI